MTSSIWSPNRPLEWNLRPKASQQTGRQDKPRSQGVHVHEVRPQKDPGFLSDRNRPCFAACAGDQGTDLGHCWTGTLQGHHQCVRQMNGDECVKINSSLLHMVLLGRARYYRGAVGALLVPLERSNLVFQSLLMKNPHV